MQKIYSSKCRRSPKIKPAWLRCLLDRQTLIIRAMRMTVFLTLACIINAFATGYSQEKLSMDLKEVKLSRVFSIIQQKTNYQFLYNDEDVAQAPPVSISVKNATVPQILKDCFRDYPLSYRIENKTVVILPKAAAPLKLQATPEVQKPAFTVRGKVTDSLGNPLVGVSVSLKGSATGTVTDGNGQYDLSLENGNGTLVFSYVGYVKQEIEIAGRPTINVTMHSSISSLDQLVVIGYGTQKKNDLTGSVGTVDNKDIMERPSINAEQSLAGRIAGVNISTNSGRPGGRTRISIRGFSSINATNDPLYVVDGIVSPNGINNIDPNDIKSVSVLKDASSTAIYGTRGANGVIIVTTERGRQNGIQVGYNAYVSVNWLPKELDVLNSKEFLGLEEEQYKNAAKFDPVGFANGKYKDPVKKRMNYLVGNTLGNRELFDLDASGIPQSIYDIDWQKMATRTSVSNSHNLSVTGGNGQTNYGLFLGYVNDNGIIKESFAKRYNIRGVIDQQVKKWLKIGGSFGYSRMNQEGVNDNNGSYDVMRYMIEFVPFIPYKYSDGSYGEAGNYEGLERVDNPLAQINEIKRVYNTNSFNGNTYVNFKLTEGLELNSTFGVNISNEIDPYFKSSKLVSNRSEAHINSSESRFWEWSNRLNYTKQINGDNKINILAGTELQKYNNLSWSANTQYLSDDYYQWYNLSAGATPLAPGSSSTDYKMQSYFGRINYNLKDKYLLTATARADGSSRFGTNNKFAFFPSAAAAWRISQEDFLKNNKTISDLKLRASYGLTGNSAIGSYRSLAALSTSAYIFNDARASGTVIGRLANPNLKWEKTTQFDLGLDVGLINNRVNLVADFYLKKTHDLLLDAPVPSTSGYTSVTRNIGSMENRGFELSVNSINIDKGDFTWSTTFNFSSLKNKITALGLKNEDIIYGFKDLLLLRVDQSVGSFYGYVRDGIWSTKEKDEAAAYGQLPGDQRILDLNKDGVINGNDRTIIGKGIPDFYGTLSNTFSYKSFDLIIELQYSEGNDVFDNSRNSGEARQGIANSYATVLDAWTPEHQNAILEQVRPTGAGYNYYMDTRKLSDGSFIRGKNLLLAYTIPSLITSRWGLNNFRFYISIQNFFLLTKYYGYDPEVSNYDSEVFSQGETYAVYPKPRILMFGLNVSF